MNSVRIVELHVSVNCIVILSVTQYAFMANYISGRAKRTVQDYRYCTGLQVKYRITGTVLDFRYCTGLQVLYRTTGTVEDYRCCTGLQVLYRTICVVQDYR